MVPLKEKHSAAVLSLRHNEELKKPSKENFKQIITLILHSKKLNCVNFVDMKFILDTLLNKI